MTDEEAGTFLKNVLCGIWSNWTPTDLDTSLWMAILRQCKYEESESALRRWYANNERHARKPFPGQIRKYLVFEHQAEKEKREPRKEFGLQRKEGGKITWFFINTGRKREPHKIEEDAEKARIRAQDLYGGEWVIIQPPQPIPDDGKRGPMALAQAIHNTLSGPNTPGKRFLIRAMNPPRTAEEMIAELGEQISVGNQAV